MQIGANRCNVQATLPEQQPARPTGSASWVEQPGEEKDARAQSRFPGHRRHLPHRDVDRDASRQVECKYREIGGGFSGECDADESFKEWLSFSGKKIYLFISCYNFHGLWKWKAFFLLQVVFNLQQVVVTCLAFVLFRYGHLLCTSFSSFSSLFI